jgi:predicted dehydrogenase
MAIHDVDWCLWTFGPAERVYAVRTGEAGHEVASVTIRHRAATIAYVDASWRNPAFATSLEVCGTSGLYQADGSSWAGFRLVEEQRAAGTGYLPPAAATPVQDDPYLLELRAAIDWFRGGEPPRASVADACEALRAVAAAEESARTGVPVAIEDAS